MRNFIGLFISGILLTMNMVSAQEATNTFTYETKAFKISLLSEGQQNGKSSILIGAGPEIMRKYAPEGTFPNATNTFLLQMAGKNILIDTGLGARLFDNMQALGISPEKVDVILITHMHGDHIGGMLRDGRQAFPEAEVYLPQPEYDYWMSDPAMNSAPENRRGSFLNARKVIEIYKDKLKLFQPDQLGTSMTFLLPGIYGIAAYGHTPGHTMYQIESQGKKLLVWADLTHAMAIQMPHPEIAVTYDTNPAQAVISRKQTLKYVVANKIPIAGMHIAFPGMGIVSSDPEDGYRFKPLEASSSSD